MNINIVIAQLRARAPLFEQRVGGAAKFEGILPEAANLRMPAAYVLPLDEQPQEQSSKNGYQQTVSERFAVVVAMSNVLDERGQKPTVDLDTIRKALFRALLGFQPGEDYDVIAFEGGELLHLDRARLYYQFEFSVEYAVTTEDTWIPTRNEELPDFEGLDLDVDAIDPFDPNRVPPGERGPDGVIDVRLSINLPTGP